MLGSRDRPKALKRVLVAEDQALIAMAIADELTDAGLEVAGPFPTCAAVMEWLHGDTPDFAILDVGLRDGPCTDVAHELKRRLVGFAIFSGSRREEAPAIFSEAPWFEKPSDLKELIDSLSLARSGHTESTDRPAPS